MFSLFQKKNQPDTEPFFPISTDMHSHILPGIDDGSPDVATSISLIKGLMALGITKSIATPHIISDMYRNTPASITAAKNELQAALKKEKINFELHTAAEYMLDSYFFELLNSGNPLLTLRDKLLLTEFSYASMPDEPGKYSFAIIMAGYQPVLAHPERYPYYYNNYKMFHHLSELGFLLQVNLLSLTGYYGKDASKVAQYLLKNNLVSFVGTDMHHERHLQALSDPRNLQIFKKNLSYKQWNIAL
jgi:tyrosine-protein phosphatase YwqE